MLSRFLQWSIIGSILILVFGVWLVSKNATVLQGELYTKLESKFSFTSAIINMQSGEQTIEAFSIYPGKDGILYDAGFREGDVILSHTKYKFYRLLYKKKGSTEPIDILSRDGIASADKNRPTTIFLNIPN
jgi:hypothetical protein